MRPGASSGEQAVALVAAGRRVDALTLLRAGAVAQDGDALLTLAAWNLAGQHVPRNLAASRALFGRAAAAGNLEAQVIHTNFVGNGTGGPRDWAKALEMLVRREARDPAARRQLALIRAMALTSDGDPASLPPAERLSDTPSVRLYRRLLTAPECRYLIETATPLFEPSMVVDPVSRRLVRNPIRDCAAAAFPYVDEDPAIHALNRRFAAITATDVSQGEPLQVFRYDVGQQFGVHSDALGAGENQRTCTALVYLNDDYDGGATVFPATGQAIRGAGGDAIVFANLAPDGTADRAARHAGMMVTRGVKLLASRWIRARPLG